MSLLPVDEALARVLNGVGQKEPQTVPIAEAGARVLAADLPALRTQPPFDASAMDGYAVRWADTAALPATLTVIGESVAGRRFEGEVGAGRAVRIFTGAPVPPGADSILLQEDARRDGDAVEVLEATEEGRHIRRAGLDFTEGSTVLEAGRQLDPAALSLAAAAGHARVDVVAAPLVAVLATGTELVAPGETAGPDQIVSSNGYGIAALCALNGARVLDLGIAPDDEGAIDAAVRRGLDAGADVLVTLGGASVGDHDLVQGVLTRAGMSLDFWKIAMRPGKPLMFGRFGATSVLGLPGNPVSSLVCAHLFLVPLMRRLAGLPHHPDIREARLESGLRANDRRQDYVRAFTWTDDDGLRRVRPFPTQDSSMLSTLAAANCLVLREPHAPEATAGDACRVLMIR